MELKESSCSNIYNVPQRLQEIPLESTATKGKKQSLKTGLLVVCLVLIIALASATIALFVKTKTLENSEKEHLSKLNEIVSNQNESNTKINLSTLKLKENEKKSNNLEMRLQFVENKTKDNIQTLKEQTEQLQNLTDKDPLYPRSCNDIQSSVYTIAYLSPFKRSVTPLQALCDLQTDGGGWLVWQRRMDGSEDFYRGWEDYVKGFGNLTGEFWLGLDNLHKLTSNGKYELRIDMEDFNKRTVYAKYKTFSVGSGPGYVLAVSGYSGTAGDSLTTHSGQKFSTKDKDQDTHSSKSCAAEYKGAWWYSACHASNPNGLYLRGDHSSYADGVNWKAFRGHHHSLKSIEMKIREI